MDQDSVKLGLLLEGAERQQKLAEAAIGKLNDQVQRLEAVVRDQIRCGVSEEMKFLQAETQRAVEALKRGKASRQCSRDALDNWSYCDIDGYRALRRLVDPSYSG
jgi:hypothetical protein